MNSKPIYWKAAFGKNYYNGIFFLQRNAQALCIGLDLSKSSSPWFFYKYFAVLPWYRM